MNGDSFWVCIEMKHGEALEMDQQSKRLVKMQELSRPILFYL